MNQLLKLFLLLFAILLPSRLLAQQVITPITIATTSQWVGPVPGLKERMTDGSGLSGSGSVFTQTHDNLASGDTVWHAGPNPGGIPGGVTGTPPFGSPPANTQAVEFDLGANYNLTAAHVWNMNQQGVVNRGVKDVQILISTTTNGAFTALTTTQFTQGTGAAGLSAQVVPLTASNVRRVRFAIQSAWSGVAGEYVGLSEVRFQGSAVILPNTAPSFSLPVGPAGLNWTARESARNWFSITSSSDGNKLAAVVESGQIYTSTDSGATWTARETNRAWRFITSSGDGSKLAAVVSNGQIYTSIDSGVTWTARESNRGWESITSSSDGSKLAAVVANGQIYTSIDSGVTWTARESNRLWLWITSSADGSKLAAVVGNGQIYTSTDSGVSWTARDSDRGWSYITSSADGSKLAAVVGNGRIYTSADSGVTWTPRDVNRGWIGITSSADGSKLAALVHNGQIYTSTDSGATWTPRESDRNWRFVASSADGGKLVAIVPSGQIYTSVGANAAVSVAAGSGAYTQAAFATAISPGPATESTQTVSFSVTGNTNPSLFATLPAISPTGTLTFTPASPSTTAGTATISVQLADNGGTANGGVDTSPVQTFTITVTAVNQMPSFTKGANQSLPAGTTTAQSVANWATAINDGDSTVTQSLTFNVTNTNSALFTAQPAVAANGTLTYTPNGTSGTATVSVTLTDDASINSTAALTTAAQTFTITVAAPVLSGLVLTPTAVITTSQWVGPTAGIKENMTNGSGLSGPGAVVEQVHDAASSGNNVWHAGPNSGGISGGATGSPPAVAGQAIEFDLGANYDLTGAHVWNMNQATYPGRGVKDVEILVSSATTGAFMPLTSTRFVQDTNAPGLAPQVVPFSGATNVRRVRFNILTAWGGEGVYVGLSEVRFRGDFATFTAPGTNLGLIPELDPTGRDILFNVAGTPGVVKTVSVQFALNPAHTWTSDVSVQLIAPDNTLAQVFLMTADDNSDLGGPYTLQDSAAGSLVAAAVAAGNEPVASGTYRAANGGTLVSLNAVFAGKAPNGTWKLRFIDNVNQDTGSVSQASLTLTTAAPGEIALQSEPNGDMTVSLTGADSSANYDLMRSTNLQNWTLLQSKTTNASGATTHTDTAPPATRVFYRYIPRP